MTGDALVAEHGDDRVLIVDGDDLLPMLDDDVRDRVGAIVSALVRMLADVLTIDGFVVRDWAGERTIALYLGDATIEHALPTGERLDVAAVAAVFEPLLRDGHALIVLAIDDGAQAIVRVRV